MMMKSTLSNPFLPFSGFWLKGGSRWQLAGEAGVVVVIGSLQKCNFILTRLLFNPSGKFFYTHQTTITTPQVEKWIAKYSHVWTLSLVISQSQGKSFPSSTSHSYWVESAKNLTTTKFICSFIFSDNTTTKSIIGFSNWHVLRASGLGNQTTSTVIQVRLYTHQTIKQTLLPW